MLFDPNDIDRHSVSDVQLTIIDHSFPLLMLVIEWLLNNRLFNWPTSFWYCMYVFVAYLPVALYAIDFTGYFPYFFADMSKPENYKWVAFVIIG